MSTKHTPGPWILQIDDCGPLAGRPEIVAQEEYDCSIVHGDGFKQQFWESARNMKEVHANARLIAAAPELLEALEKWLPAARDMGWDTAKAESVIAKAKGEAE